jgi:hypothetical protein
MKTSNLMLLIILVFAATGCSSSTGCMVPGMVGVFTCAAGFISEGTRKLQAITDGDKFSEELASQEEKKKHENTEKTNQTAKGLNSSENK